MYERSREIPDLIRNTNIYICCRQYQADKGCRGEGTAHLLSWRCHKLRLTFARREGMLPNSLLRMCIPPRSGYLPPNTNCSACFRHKEESREQETVTSGHGQLKLEEKKEKKKKKKLKRLLKAGAPALAQTAFATITWPAAPCTKIAINMFIHLRVCIYMV